MRRRKTSRQSTSSSPAFRKGSPFLKLLVDENLAPGLAEQAVFVACASLSTTWHPIWHRECSEDEILRDFPYLEKEDFQAVYEFFASIPERISVLECWRRTRR